MRKLTDPGVAPPAPGSVSPPWEEEVPTRPDNQLKPEIRQLMQIVDSMPTVERRRFIAMVESYRKCSLGRRVLIEELARELAL